MYKREANNAFRVYWLALFGNRLVVEIEKVLHSSRFQLTDVATAGSGARNQGADVTLVKIRNAFNAWNPPALWFSSRVRIRKSDLVGHTAAAFASTENREPRPTADLTSTR